MYLVRENGCDFSANVSCVMSVSCAPAQPFQRQLAILVHFSSSPIPHYSTIPNGGAKRSNIGCRLMWCSLLISHPRCCKLHVHLLLTSQHWAKVHGEVHAHHLCGFRCKNSVSSISSNMSLVHIHHFLAFFGIPSIFRFFVDDLVVAIHIEWATLSAVSRS